MGNGDMRHSPAYRHALDAVAGYNATLDRLVWLTAAIDLKALDNAIECFSDPSASNAALKLSMTASRMWRAAAEIKLTLPSKQPQEF